MGRTDKIKNGKEKNKKIPKKVLTKKKFCDIIVERRKGRVYRGGIAQLARAIGSYPIGHGFKSNSRYQARWSSG